MFVVLAFKSEATLSVGERESTWGQVSGRMIKGENWNFWSRSSFSTSSKGLLMPSATLT